MALLSPDDFLVLGMIDTKIADNRQQIDNYKEIIKITEVLVAALNEVRRRITEGQITDDERSQLILSLTGGRSQH